MELLGLAILLCVVAVVFISRRKSAKKHSLGPQIELSNFRFDPPLGTHLQSHQPITVTFNYHYSNAEEPLYVWAKVDDQDVRFTYQGSVDTMAPGVGEISRYFYLKQAGKVEGINIEVKNQDFKVVFLESREVDYEISTNHEMETIANDGVGSKIVSASTNLEAPSVLEVGTTVYVDIEYDIDSDEGLNIWAIPDTECQMTYEGSVEKQNGKGIITKGFMVSEVCELKSVRLLMENTAGETVFDSTLEVDIQFKSTPQ